MDEEESSSHVLAALLLQRACWKHLFVAEEYELLVDVQLRKNRPITGCDSTRLALHTTSCFRHFESLHSFSTIRPRKASKMV